MTDIYHSEREIERMENNVDDEDLCSSAVADDLESLNCTSDDANVVKTLIEYQHSQSTANDTKLFNTFNNRHTSG